MQMLTLSLGDWTIQKIVEFFNIREYAVKQARKLKKRKRDFNNPFQLYTIEKDWIKKQKNVLLNSMRETMAVVCVQVKKIVLASETKISFGQYF